MTKLFDLAKLLAAHLSTTDLERLILNGPERALRLVRQGTDFVIEAAETASPNAVIVRAGTPGVFLRRHPLGTALSAPEGAMVGKDEFLGFLRIGPLLTAVPAPVGGTIVAILADDGAIVGFGTPLFEIEPDENGGGA